MLDPHEQFIVSKISRAEIADNLNTALNRKEFVEDDERLTSDWCHHYAIEIGGDPESIEMISQETAEMILQDIEDGVTEDDSSRL